MKKRRKLKNWVIIVFMIICLFLIGFSIFNIISWKNSIDRNENIKKKTEEYIIINEDEENESEKYIVDFDNLKEQNPDTVAYLKVNNTNIDYIVVRGEDNSYYLKHNFNKEWNRSGWIFADYKNKFDGADKNIVIFGHNTKNGSMFGTLKNILDEEWYKNEENLQVTLVTERGTFLYQVFSIYSIIPEDYYINTEFKSDKEYEEFLKTIKSRSIYDYGTDFDINDKILTLSSCTANGSKRVVLHAKLINKID